MEGDFPIGAGIYTIPANTIIMKVDDKSIGNGLSGSDSLYLVDLAGVVTDSLGWNDIVCARLFYRTRAKSFTQYTL